MVQDPWADPRPIHLLHIEWNERESWRSYDIDFYTLSGFSRLYRKVSNLRKTKPNSLLTQLKKETGTDETSTVKHGLYK